MNKRSHLPRRAWATALAVCAHLLALLALGWRIPKLSAPSPIESSPAIAVTLLRPEIRPRALPRTASPGRAPQAPRTSQRVLIAPTPGAAPLSAPGQTPPPPAPPEAGLGDPRLRNALRGLVGCADPAAYRLTREEREACDQRLASAKPAPVGHEYSADELAQFDAGKTYDPILVRKAHNGCLPRVADRPAATSPGGPPPSTRSGATTTFGVGCAWSF